MGSSISSCLRSLPPLTDFFPPTPEAYTILLNTFQYFPLFTILQWLLSYHPAGKTSLKSSLFNIPGRLAWFVMEVIGPVNLLHILWTLPARLNVSSLPLPNKLVASLYVIHYVNRAIVSPFFAAPSMSPIHAFIVLMAIAFNWMNSACLAAWLVGYNTPVVFGKKFQESAAGKYVLTTTTTVGSSSTSTTASTFLPWIGMGLFVTGMIGNIYSERSLFRMRREEADRRMMAKKKDEKNEDSSSSASSKKNKNRDDKYYHKVYIIPPRQGVFAAILYPHYVFEWLEWFGFALVGTAVVSPAAFSTSLVTPPVILAPWLVPAAWLAEKLHVPLPLPAVVFVVNAVANMLPHARWGRKWYVDKFGEGAVAGRGAVVPWCRWM